MKQTRLGWMTILVTAVSAVAMAQSGIPRGVHGDATGAFQEQAIGVLQEGINPDDVIPPGVDSDYWNSLIPDGNVTTKAKYELGKKLYFDTRLSVDGTVSCATCHDVTRGFGDGLPTSEGVDKMMNGAATKQFGTRNAPTTMNPAPG